MRGRQQRVLDVSRQLLSLGVGPGAGMAPERLESKLIEAHAPDPRARAREVALDQVRVEPDGFEHLGAAVGAHRADAHLRDHLEQPLAERRHHAVLRAGRHGVLRVGAALEVVERLQHQVGVDRAGPVADQHRHVMHLARLAGLHHEARARARARAYEVVMHAGQSQQGGHGHTVGPHAAVAEDEHPGATGQGQVGLAAEALERGGQPVGTLDHRPGGVEGARGQRAGLHRPQTSQLVVAENRVVEHQTPRLLRGLLQQVALGTQPG